MGTQLNYKTAGQYNYNKGIQISKQIDKIEMLLSGQTDIQQKKLIKWERIKMGCEKSKKLDNDDKNTQKIENLKIMNSILIVQPVPNS